MTKYMLWAALGLFFATPLPLYAAADTASASTPVGEWLVKDKTAHIRILNCGATLWGVISWAKEPGTDAHNPDITKRRRPVLGLPILLAMQPDANSRWEGRIYNADNGKTYTGDIYLNPSGNLHVEGCVMGVLCGGEDWTRLKEAAGAHPEALCRQITGM